MVSSAGRDRAGPDPAEVVAWERGDVAGAWPWPDATSDKYSRGVVGLDTGSDEYPGAGVLSALGAVYAGAGMVRCLGPEPVFAAVTHVLPNVVRAEGRVQAWLVGSGWGERAGDRLDELLVTGLPLVVDADGLRHLPKRLDRPGVLLTPHAGELARLLGGLRPDVEADPIGAVRAAVERYGATVLLKGATQYVATPGDDRVHLAVPGPAWTAQAGSGDVLAGICVTLLARSRPGGGGRLRGVHQALTAGATPARTLRMTSPGSCRGRSRRCGTEPPAPATSGKALDGAGLRSVVEPFQPTTRRSDHDHDRERPVRRLRRPARRDPPLMRWWWFGPDVTDAEIDRELEAMKAAGIGGVEVAYVYPLSEVTEPLGSAGFLGHLRHAAEPRGG